MKFTLSIAEIVDALTRLVPELRSRDRLTVRLPRRQVVIVRATLNGFEMVGAIRGRVQSPQIVAQRLVNAGAEKLRME